MTRYPFVLQDETADLADDVRAMFDDLAANLPPDLRAQSGECHPTLDVFETDAAFEVVVDVCGVPAAALRVLFRDGIVIVAGEKTPPRGSDAQAFHTVEREFGRFVRAVRLSGAFDVHRSRATLRSGELSIQLPKQAERRGRPFAIPVTTDRA